MSLRVDDEVTERLDSLAERLEASRSDVIRLSIETALAVLEVAYQDGKRSFGALAVLDDIKRSHDERLK